MKVSEERKGVNYWRRFAATFAREMGITQWQSRYQTALIAGFKSWTELEAASDEELEKSIDKLNADLDRVTGRKAKTGMEGN